MLDPLLAYLSTMNAAMFLSTIAFAAVFSFCLHLYIMMHLKPSMMRSRLKKQGVRGPKPSFLLGNIPDIRKMQAEAEKPPVQPGKVSHEWAYYIFPFYDKWMHEYGKLFTFSLGTMQVLYVSDLELAKQVTLYTSMDLGKPLYQQKERGALLGTGILTSNGPIWAYQRKMMQAELFTEKVKNMHDLMLESVTSLVSKWDSQIHKRQGVGYIRIDDDLKIFSADVITRACFGSNYSESQDIFLRIGDLRKVMVKKSWLLGIPGSRHLPIKSNRETWRLEKEIRRLIMNVVEKREKSTEEHKDLLHVIMEGAKGCNLEKMDEARFISDNCKNVYIAGDETTGMTIAWTLLLLAANPEWQNRLRKEVLEISGGQRSPDYENLRQMKVLTMVIQESMRLYPTVPSMARETLKDLEFGELKVPKGVSIWLPIYKFGRDAALWGPDAEEFKPERFANGVAGACKIPQLYIPFGGGPRICIGLNLAMMEMRLAIAVLISKFSFAVPPDYCHSPAFRFIIQPENELNLILERI